MNYSMRFVVGSIIAMALLSGCSGSNTEALHQGSIKFAANADGGGSSCSIPFSDVDVNLNKNKYGCEDDVYSYFMLDSAPSAALIHLNSDVGCPRGPSSLREWRFDLKTIKHPTTTPWISIRSLNATETGAIVKAGVILVKKHFDWGDIDAELECVELRVSPLP